MLSYCVSHSSRSCSGSALLGEDANTFTLKKCISNSDDKSQLIFDMNNSFNIFSCVCIYYCACACPCGYFDLNIHANRV